MPRYTKDEELELLRQSVRSVPVLMNYLDDTKLAMLSDLLQATLETGYSDGFKDGFREGTAFEESANSE